MPIPAFVGPLAGAAVAGLSTWLGQRQANEDNKQQSLQQMQFQERMSSTAYQRAVQDMKLSGINPMLAYMQGGASSPGGAQTHVQDAIGPAVASAQHARRLGAELQLMRQTAMREQSQEQLNWAARENMYATRDNVHANTARVQQEMLETQLRMEAMRLSFPGLRNQAAVEGSRFGRFASYAQRVSQSIFGGAGLSGSYNPGLRIGRFGVGR